MLREKLHFGRVLSVLIFVGIIVGGGIMFEAYNKSLPLSSVCVFMYSRDSTRQRAHVRELKVILMLVLGRHECVQGKFYININKLVFSKSVSQG